MAQRRMFSNKIIDTDAFMDMPSSSQLLYFHLGMKADDEGFVSAPKRIIRMIGCSEDDMKILIAKKFIIPFESGVCVIRHWKIHNYIQKDRYTETMYINEKSMLCYENNVYNLYTKCIQNVVQDGYSSDTQVRIGKVRLELGKDRLGNKGENISPPPSNIPKDSVPLLSSNCPTYIEKEIDIELDKDIDIYKECASKDAISSKELKTIIATWNDLKLSQVIAIRNTRLKLLKARIKEYSLEDVIRAINLIKESDFLRGQNNKNWTISFDWLIKPNNFVKVLEGNYTNKSKQGDDDNGIYDFSTRKKDTKNDSSEKRYETEEVGF